MSLYWLILIVPACVGMGLLAAGLCMAAKDGDMRADAMRAYVQGHEAGKREASK